MDDPNVCSFLQDPVLGYPQSFPERHALRRCELNDPLPCDDQFWFLYIKTEVAGSDEEIAASSIGECLTACETTECCHAVNWTFTTRICQLISNVLPDEPPRNNLQSIHIRRCNSPVVR